MLNIQKIPAYIIHVNGSERIKNITTQLNKNIFKNIQIFDAYTPYNLKQKNKTYYDKYYDEFYRISPTAIGVNSKEFCIKTCCLTLSHLDIIKSAKENNLENVIILEDDFNIKCIDTFKQKSNIDINFSILHLGGYYENDSIINKINDNIANIKAINGTFAYIVNNNFYTYIIESIEKYYSNNGYLYAIDNFYSMVLYPQIGCMGFVPPLINSIPSISHLQEQYIDHYSFFSKRSKYNI